MQAHNPPKILWTADPLATAERHAGARVGVPSLLISGLEPPALAPWIEGSAWAAGVPLVLLGNAENVAELSAFAAGHERRRSGGAGKVTALLLTGGRPFDLVVGPPHLLPSRAQTLNWPTNESPIDRGVRVARVAAHRAKEAAGGHRHVAWEIGAGRSGGSFAVGAALELGRAVAVEGGGAGPIFVACTRRYGVDVVGDLVALEA